MRPGHWSRIRGTLESANGRDAVAPNGRKSKLEMLAAFLSDAAVLVLVFVPLEFYTKGQLSVNTAVTAIFLSGGILALAIIIERRRP